MGFFAFLFSGAPISSCLSCPSTHFLPIATIHEFRPTGRGVVRVQVGFLASCARCGARQCVTKAGVYKGVGGSGMEPRDTAPASRTREKEPGQPPNGVLRTVDSDQASWRGPRT